MIYDEYFIYDLRLYEYLYDSYYDDDMIIQAKTGENNARLEKNISPVTNVTNVTNVNLATSVNNINCFPPNNGEFVPRQNLDFDSDCAMINDHYGDSDHDDKEI